MRDSMKLVKAGAAFLIAILVFLLLTMLAEKLYHVGPSEEGAEMAGEEEFVGEAVEQAATEAAPEVDFATLMGSADPAKGAKIFKKCKSCHSLEPGKNGVGPSLHGVVGRPIASVEGFNYSGALKNLGGEWTPEHLFAFLENPKAYAPGTKMSFAGLKKPEDRVNLIAYLEQASQ